LQNILLKFKKYPIGFIKTAFYKVIISPIVYGHGNGYKADEYWRDRLSNYGNSIRGVGDESLSEKDNQIAYTEAAQIFIDYCSKLNIDFTKANVLEIGCGTGFYTQILSDFGVKSYLGVDITDVLFPTLKDKFPGFNFIKKDITTDEIFGEFDLIIMIDLIQHIVEYSKLNSAMNQIKSRLSNSGIFIVAPLLKKKKRIMFYLIDWSMDNLKSCFYDGKFGELVPFRTGCLLSVRK